MISKKRARANLACSEGIDSKPPTRMPYLPAPTSKSQASTSVSTSFAMSTRAQSSQPEVGEPLDQPLQQRNAKDLTQRQSWYSSWRRLPKSSASTQVDREPIMAGTLRPQVSADLGRFNKRLKSSKNSKNPSESQNDTGDEVAPNQGSDSCDESQKTVIDLEPHPAEPPTTTDINMLETGTESETTAVDVMHEALSVKSEPTPTPRPASSGWFGWFGRPSAPEQLLPVATDRPTKEGVAAPEQQHPEPERQPAEVEPPPHIEEVAPETSAEPGPKSEAQQLPPPNGGGGWFGLWGGGGGGSPTQPTPQQPPPTSESSQESQGNESAPQPSRESEVSMHDAPLAELVPEPRPNPGSTWAFWSRDTWSKGPAGSVGKNAKERGQLAVVGEQSEAHPVQAQAALPQEPPSKGSPPKAASQDSTPLKTPTSGKNKGKAKSQATRNSGPSASVEIENVAPGARSNPKAEIAKSSPSAQPVEPNSKAVAIEAKNLVLPALKDTYYPKEHPSLIYQVAQMLLRPQQARETHVYLSSERRKIRRAVAIGVHGLFPANYLRPIVGQPTGTSIRFANNCAESIRRWADTNGCGDCEIEKVALEGEGKILERVDSLWKLLLNWSDQIRDADLVVFACHSQGVPVAIMLLEKLFQLGMCKTSTTTVGVCAMAGVCLGPFHEYRSGMGMLMGSGAELWEFADPKSDVSRRLKTALETVLYYGTRITFIASIDDQLVPIESAIFSTASHPYIYRAVFIDGQTHTPDFISHLVGFTLKLRNLGTSDHGLIRELSLPLAGSLYSGAGHSRVYNDGQVYDLAVAHTLETAALVKPPPCEFLGASAKPVPSNPYNLPWIMRGLLEEPLVKGDLAPETVELLRQFDDWKPVTKTLRDVKYRLEVVRSKL